VAVGRGSEEPKLSRPPPICTRSILPGGRTAPGARSSPHPRPPGPDARGDCGRAGSHSSNSSSLVAQFAGRRHFAHRMRTRGGRREPHVTSTAPSISVRLSHAPARSRLRARNADIAKHRGSKIPPFLSRARDDPGPGAPPTLEAAKTPLRSIASSSLCTASAVPTRPAPVRSGRRRRPA